MKITLEAVEGRCCPVPGHTGRFYGLKKARGDDGPVVHRVPGGLSYACAGAFQVDARADGEPRDRFVRRALIRGDLRRAPTTKKSAPAKADKPRSEER